MDIGWNAIIKNGVPEAIPSNQDSTDEIYPRFGAFVPYINYNGTQSKLYTLAKNYNDYLYGEVDDWYHSDADDDCSGYSVYQDSVFTSFYSPKYPDDFKDGSNISCSMRENSYYSSKGHTEWCGERWVCLGFATWDSTNLNLSYCYNLEDDETYENDWRYFHILFAYRNISKSSEYEPYIKNLFTQGAHTFPVLNLKKEGDGKNNTHDSWYPFAKNTEINITLGNPVDIYSSLSSFAKGTFGNNYEDNLSGKYLYSNVIWKNKKYGWFFPSLDTNLNKIEDDRTLYFELSFNNGDTGFNLNKLVLSYKQKYAYCYHSLYNPQWKNGKYEYLVNKNDITNPEYCTKIN